MKMKLLTIVRRIAASVLCLACSLVSAACTNAGALSSSVDSSSQKQYQFKISNQNIPVKVGETLTYPQEYAYVDGQDVPCRDPFILPYDGKYFLYKSAGREGIHCLVSNDLKNWSKPVLVYQTPADFHGVKDFFWAPECHYYKGNFYIFTSVFSGETQHRNVSVYRADNPLGPFVDIANGSIAPRDWDTIDGTLYIDEQEQPWLVFVHEWTSMPDGNGSMVAAKLSEDFTHLISDPIHLFYAKDATWATSGVTDGPFMYRMDNGTLLMIWSNFSQLGYVVGLARSKTGEINGPWEQCGFLCAKKTVSTITTDGGHGMIFQRNDGAYILTLHAPQTFNREQEGVFEHVTMYEIVEVDDKIKLKIAVEG